MLPRKKCMKKLINDKLIIMLKQAYYLDTYSIQSTIKFKITNQKKKTKTKI